ncbi:MAG: GTP-binding protein [Candidatus Omnitrophota bacterium]
MSAEYKRNFILLGHAQSGKTSVAESLLYFTKATTRKGSVLEGTTISDYSFDEIERKSSINSSFLHCDYKGIRIQMVDSPGYADFLARLFQEYARWTVRL